MNIQLNIVPPLFQVDDWVRLHHPMYKNGTEGMITQTDCFIRVYAVRSPPGFRVAEFRYVYFLHNIPDTFFAEADLEYIYAADKADENEG